MGELMQLAVYKQFKEHECWVCGALFAITTNLEGAKRRDNATLYCPNGCKLGLGESNETKLRRELEAVQRDRAAALERERALRVTKEKADKQLRASKKKLARVAAGVCPECNRTFPNLARHMQCKHATETA